MVAQLKFLIDANISPELCRLFESYGHEVMHVSKVSLNSDRQILKRAISENYIVVTRDADFISLIEAMGRPKGLVIIKGDTSKDETLTSIKLARAIRLMLDWFKGSKAEELEYVDVQIDRSGIGYRSLLKNDSGIPVMFEFRQIYDLGKKLVYYEKSAAVDHEKRYGKDSDPIVDEASILSGHRNLLREQIGYIKERINCAVDAEVSVCAFNSLSKVIFNSDEDFLKWIRNSTSKEGLESKEFKAIVARVDNAKIKSRS